MKCLTKIFTYNYIAHFFALLYSILANAYIFGDFFFHANCSSVTNRPLLAGD